MSNLRVKLILDLVNRMKGPAGEARAGLKQVGAEADRLKAKAGAERLKRDMLLLGSSARSAADGVRDVSTAADRLGRARGAKILRDDLRATEQQARRTAKVVAASGMGGSAAGGAGAGAALAVAGRNALLPLAGAAGIYAGGRATVGKSISFEKAMADVRKKVDIPEGESFEKLERDIVSMSIALGQSRENVAGVVAEAGAAGTAFKDLASFTRLATKAGIAWDMPIREAAQKLFEVRASTGKNLAELSDYVDKVNALGDTSAAKERDILEMSARSIAAAKEAGVSEDTSLAFLTAMRSIGIQPEVGSRGFNALVSKMATADESKKTAEGLKMLGLNAKTMAQTMKTDATKALTDLFTALDKSKDPVKAAVKIFGQEWFDEMLRTKGSIAEVRKNLEMLGKRSNWQGSAERNLNIDLATTANHLERLKALSSEVGDRLGRWALPGINEAIERLIAGMNALDERAAGKKADTAVAGKLAEGKTLTPEERKRVLDDRLNGGSIRTQASQISARMDGTGTMGRIERGEVSNPMMERQRLIARQLDRRIAELETAGSNTPRARSQLSQLRSQRAALNVGDTTPLPPNRRAADMDDRQVSRSRAIETEAALKALANEVRTLRTLAGENRPAGDRLGFREDGFSAQARLRSLLGGSARPSAFTTSLGQPVRSIDPNTGKPVKTFSGGYSSTGEMPRTGSGITSFGLGGGQRVKDAFTIDLGEAGMTMMERYTASIKAGQPQAESAATGVGDGVKDKLSGIDASAEGKAVADSFAAGIKSGTPGVLAAASELAAAASRAISRAGGGLGKPGALHDGVSE